MAVGTAVRLLSVLSAECDELACRVEDMHRFLPDENGTSRVSSAELVTAAQDIDFVHQHLSELSRFLMLVAEMTPGDADLDFDWAASNIRLSDLRDRLRGVEASDSESRVRPGELELL